MKHIDTTATKVTNVKQLAKRIKKEKGIQLCKAQEEAAILYGYDSFHHLHTCYKHTQALVDRALNLHDEQEDVKS